jgi:hypothetical protein
MDGKWEVEAVVWYRTHYRKEQYLIKWKQEGLRRGPRHVRAAGAPF